MSVLGCSAGAPGSDGNKRDMLSPSLMLFLSTLMQGPRGLLGPKGPPGIPGPPVGDTLTSSPNLTPDLSSSPPFLTTSFLPSSPPMSLSSSGPPLFLLPRPPKQHLVDHTVQCTRPLAVAPNNKNPQEKQTEALTATGPRPAGLVRLHQPALEMNVRSDRAFAVHPLG